MSATNRKLRRSTLKYVANLAAEAQGCRCDRIIVPHGTSHVQIQHDEDCVMRHAGRQYMLYWPDRCGR